MGIRLGRSQLRYCIKVGMAAGLGYALTQRHRNEYVGSGAAAANQLDVQ
jgi:hypothetical protein